MLRSAGRIIVFAIMLFGLCSLLGACGQKGKLYLPEKTTERSNG